MFIPFWGLSLILFTFAIWTWVVDDNQISDRSKGYSFGVFLCTSLVLAGISIGLAF